MGILDERAGFSGKVAVVIGGASGIGAAVTYALAAAGLDVAFCDRKAPESEALQVRLHDLARQVYSEVLDATEPTALERFYSEVAARFPRLDVLVNVVGGTMRGAFADATPEKCDLDVQRNYGYVLNSFRHAIPLMRRSGCGGSIINFTTIEAHRGAAGFAVYAGAKAATTNFSRAMAVELGSERIRVNTIAPDTTPSEGNLVALPPEVRQVMASLPPEYFAQAMRMYIPIGTPPSPDDLADGVLFLASDLSRFITGTTLHIDGGTFAASGFINWPHGDGFVPVPLGNSMQRLFGGR
jgi:NAD(P)-dependent dehydrogenase (short-subunit alcohol dehydrogenase family)